MFKKVIVFSWFIVFTAGPFLFACSSGDTEPDTTESDPAEPAEPEETYDFEAEEAQFEEVARGPCNPVDDGHCLLPYPSSFFLAEDMTTASGKRVDFDSDSLPINSSGNAMDITDLNRKDGFSILGTLFAYFEGPLHNDLRTPSDIATSLSPESDTYIIHAESGELLPHFIEIEVAAEGTGRQLLLLRPMQPMRHGERYIVGIRNIRKADDTLAVAPAGFATLRDRTPTELADLGRQRSHYENNIFPALENAGVSRNELQLAWDFSVSSAESSTHEANHMRELADANGIPTTYATTSVDEFDCSEGVNVGRILRGTFPAPLFTEGYEPGNLLARDENDMPMINGTVDVPFTVIVPCSAITGAEPATLVQYGHGLLDTQITVERDYVGEMANRFNWVFFASDWKGMTNLDLAALVDLASVNPAKFSTIPDNLREAFVHAYQLAKLMKGALTEDAMLQNTNGDLLVDTSAHYYFGNSLGTAVGAGYLGFSPDIERAALGVGGMPFTLVLTRSVEFLPFQDMLLGAFPDWADVSLTLALFQLLWDTGESSGWIHKVPGNTDSPKRVLLQAAIGDRSLSTYGSHVMARAVGATLLQPAARDIFGLEGAQGPLDTGSALVEFDYGLPEVAEAVIDTTAPDPHENPRRDHRGQDQIRKFLEEGIIQNYCDGPCVSEFEPIP